MAGDSLSRHLPKILPALLVALSEAIDTDDEKQVCFLKVSYNVYNLNRVFFKEFEYCQSVILSANDEQGARTIVDHLLESARNDSPVVRRAAALLLNVFCSQSKSSLSANVPQLLRGLILLLTDDDDKVLVLCWEALNAVTKSLESKEQIEYVSEVRNAIRYAASDLKNSPNAAKHNGQLPGFCLSKGISPILPIFREAILNGTPDQKDQAAQGLSEVIQLTSAEALKPSVVNIAGPLIRILGDRFAWNVKVAVLDTLSLLLAKVDIMLRPFIPQLQQTFLKSLNDGNRTVRLRAANALSHLIVVHTRCDPVFTDLHNAIKSGGSGDDNSVRETMLHALRLTIVPAGEKMSDPIRKAITTTVVQFLNSSDDVCRTTAGACLGALCKCLPDKELNTVVNDNLLDDDNTSDWVSRHGKSVALRIALKEAPSRLLKPNWIEKIAKTLTGYITSDRIPIVISGIKGSAYFFKEVLAVEGGIPQPLLSTFSRVSFNLTILFDVTFYFFKGNES